MKQVLPGPPGVYTLYSTRVEAVGSAAVDQLVDARREVQEAMDQEGAEDRAAVGRMGGVSRQRSMHSRRVEELRGKK